MASNAIYLITIWAIPVIIAITFHEAAHDFVAHLLGDDTAWWLGRVSLNPAKHIDRLWALRLSREQHEMAKRRDSQPRDSQPK